MEQPKGWTYIPRQAKPYSVKISINGEHTYIGAFATEEEAHAEYLKAREAHPMQPKNGGTKPGYRHPRKECDICHESYADHVFNRHYKACKRKANTKPLKPFRRNRVISYKGEMKTIAEVLAITGVPVSVVRQRYYYGWSDKRLFTQSRKFAKKEN